MFGESPLADAKRFVKAFVTNQIAWLVPAYYLRMTAQTGRGVSEIESAEQAVEYFERCFSEYFEILGVAPSDIESWLKGKTIVEYGPGDIPGVALLMVARGAAKVICVDRFPLVSMGPKNVEVLKQLMARLDPVAAQRAASCFSVPADPARGFDSRRLEYAVRPSGLLGMSDVADMVISRAVLEHVNDLLATFRDMDQALRGDGIAIHLIDLKSHGLHRRNPLDFLTWPAVLWRWMYSHKGVPNRWRVDRYREVLSQTRLKTRSMQPTAKLDQTVIGEVRPRLAMPFKQVSDDDLSWQGFWLVCQK